MDRKQVLMNGLLIAVASLALASCGSGKARSAFVAGCTGQGAPKSRCTCVYEKLESKYGVDAMETMQKTDVAPPNFSEAMISAAAQCGANGAALSDSGAEPTAAGTLGEPVTPNSGNGEAIPQASDEAVVDNAIAITASSEGGDEYKDARQIAAGDLNGDSLTDAAVLFTVEVGSTNTSAQFLSTFLRQPDGALTFASTMPLSGTGGDAISGVVIEGGSILLKTLTRGPDDPDCCPSVEATVEYLLHNGKLKRVG